MNTLKKEEYEKDFSKIAILIRVAMSLFIILLLPLVFFIIFITIEPREIEPINNYLIKQINKLEIQNLKYDSAKMSFNRHLEIVYIVSNIQFNKNNNIINLPNIILKIKLIDILFKNIIINKIELNNFSSYFINDGNKTEKSQLNIKDIQTFATKLIDYLNNKKLIFKKLQLKDSIFYVFDNNTKQTEKITVNNSFISFNKKFNTLKINTNTKLTSNHDIVQFNSRCVIENTKATTCITSFDNVFMMNVIKIFTKNTILQKYSNNIDGNFNIKFNILLKDYFTPIKSNFTINSKNGSFLIGDIFPNRIFYNNLNITGQNKGKDAITIDKLNAQIWTNNKTPKEYTDFSMNMDFKNKQFINLNFDINSANIKDLNSFWPLFLEANGVRTWVVKHFKSGYIKNAFAYINFKYDVDNYILEHIDSNVIFDKTLLDYDEHFPKVNNLFAKAIFSKDNMNIQIYEGYIENTKILDGNISTVFSHPTINIKANTTGKAYEMFYFINNEEQNTIKNIVNSYINGTAESNIHVDIPLYKNISFDSVLIDIKSKVTNNNTFIFDNNSAFNLVLKKDYNSNIFKTKIDLKESEIKFNEINFSKLNNINTELFLDIVIRQNDILLKNIYTKSNIINLNGNGKIIDSQLDQLILNNITYGNNNFSINYKNNKDNNVNYLSIIGKKIELYLSQSNINKNANFKYNFNFITECIFDDITINNKYSIKNINIKSEYSNNTIKYVDIHNNYQNNNTFNVFINNIDQDDKKYTISGNINNLGNFLNNSNISNYIVHGDATFSGFVGNNNNIYLNLKIKNKFSIITKNIENITFFSYILNSNLIDKKTKNNLIKENLITFNELNADIYYFKKDNVLKISNFFTSSDSIFGIGIGGKGKFFLNNGKIIFGGVVIPADKINTLFGINKIPIINRLLFGQENNGLFTLGFSFNKESYNDDYVFKLIPAGSASANTIKNLLLLLMVL